MTIYCVNLKKNGYCARNNTPVFVRIRLKKEAKKMSRFERLIIYPLLVLCLGYLIKGEMGINAQKRQVSEKIVAREIRARHWQHPAKAV